MRVCMRLARNVGFLGFGVWRVSVDEGGLHEGVFVISGRHSVTASHLTVVCAAVRLKRVLL